MRTFRQLNDLSTQSGENVMRRRSWIFPSQLLAVLILACCLSLQSLAQMSRSSIGANRGSGRDSKLVEGLSLDELKAPESEMRPVIERYTLDRGSLTRSYPVSLSPARRTRFKDFYTEWMGALQKLNFDSMSQAGKVDYVLFRNHLEYELRQLDIQTKQFAEMETL